MNVRLSCLLACWLPLAAHAVDVEPGKDPVPSVMWAFYHKQFLAEAPFVFDERVKLLTPPFAEDARQVPLEIDARAFKGHVLKILAWAELNPLPKIVDFQPKAGVLPWLSLRIRIEQATPLRAAVLTDDGLWHVGSTLIDAAGGGCTAPSVVRTQPGWEEHIGEVLGGRYPRGEFSRVRVQVAHPMDNGMVSGIPEFYLNHAQLRGQDGQVLAELELFPAVSENPNLAFDIDAPGPTRLVLRDNSGNEFDAAIP
ncbi:MULTISPECIES: quinoprotein dehydrogenase-associated SoxYZ-like carrier [unclassified Pseudomonas]|uniref:quinoprotein dehydrogenase-associated SoxYZ-like carrier n=1 Tax=unclassified Pseudomonas TaxID=196821 RepID=UPI000C8808EB|nr:MULTISPECIES: quinoprotein dehydrogenase-associated SoxYZ-like carrier [unclassified Pseudomonas]PMX26066.1 quinoprotein dehydrogenase-associated SoxYZ-like carrier [Pseudomonas sp. GW460-12]PMX33159.1 quinoprotein dehydrogenase-associated SoxYZ-like carrier [Pseudomonas sp. MPR-R2A4]PMX40940.1 quinoprotein dehydrogenase-associated SoxYZ-like carrier [Pseudomonas sp. MPR-R2A7]PMX53432.1 quinoprotein dehydrogenase-associated SoxYZ-like carrier [Pseudomonas sp. MPR-R2A6]PMX92247.1 quinoprotei